MRICAGLCLQTPFAENPLHAASFMSRILMQAAFLLSLAWSVQGLKITRMVVPPVADLRREMNLECLFDMEGEELYSVKWYKDYQEFFRYRPHGDLQAETMSFPVAGVHFDPDDADCGHNHCTLTLRHLTREHSGGSYRCEVSSEAPSFRLGSDTVNVTVAALPEEHLHIEGLLNSYSEGDTVSAKCISAPSDPAPILTWYINGLQSPPRYVEDAVSSAPDEMGLVSRIIALRFQAERKSSREDSIELRCVSTLPGVPLPSQEAARTVTFRGVQPQVSNNQKLHWYSSGGVGVGAGRVLWTLVFVALARWVMKEGGCGGG